MLIALGTRNQRPADLTVAEVMRSPVVTCGPTDDVALALSTMRDRKIRRLRVVDHVPYDEVMTAFKGICDHHQLMTQQAAQAWGTAKVEARPGVGHAL